jgi:hypothetical protein
MTTENQDEPQFPRGTIVTIDDRRCPGLYKVTNRGPKNYTLSPVNTDGSPASGRGAKMPGYLLHQYNPNAPAGRRPVPGPHFVVGELVTIRGRDGVWVVLADKVDKVNIVKLGGDGDRYLRAHPAALTRLVLGELAGVLTAEKP